MSERRPYIVTERAGPYVACRRVKPGQELLLTPAEAETELRDGTLRRAPDPAPDPAPVATPSKRRSRRARTAVEGAA